VAVIGLTLHGPERFRGECQSTRDRTFPHNSRTTCIRTVMETKQTHTLFPSRVENKVR